ncbi:hypothetical protein Y032_0048g1694 [Ancylostoma ceylanicum]|uniref:Uncharacterized protein n=1 Tax=Ancylostoma ceylanicum TaxID=53326 RepID=A0A016UBD6_9BILA|nr:hypothetical protein Y032_0048g1694 [Ancylostoma ceylanicum]
MLVSRFEYHIYQWVSSIFQYLVENPTMQWRICILAAATLAEPLFKRQGFQELLSTIDTAEKAFLRTAAIIEQRTEYGRLVLLLCRKKCPRLRSQAAPLALLGGDPSRQPSPDIEVFPYFFTKTYGRVVQNSGYYSQEFFEVRGCQNRHRPLLAQVFALREVDSN